MPNITLNEENSKLLENKIIEYTEKSKTHLEKLKATANEFASEIYKSIFDLLPEVEFISWDQYTPSFNDGDPCYFSVHSPSFLDKNGENISIDYQIKGRLNKLFHAIPPNFMFIIYDDYASIVVGRDGSVVVEECEDEGY